MNICGRECLTIEIEPNEDVLCSDCGQLARYKVIEMDGSPDWNYCGLCEVG